MEIAIRNMSYSDVDTMLSISIDADQVDNAERSLCKSELDEWVNSSYTSINKDFFVAEASGSPIGFIGLELWPGKKSINRIFARGVVLPHYRHLGIGARLMHAAETRAKELASLFNNGLIYSLDVLCRSSQNGNIALCKAFGMEEVREFSTQQIDLGNHLLPLPTFQDNSIKFRSFNLEQDNTATREAYNEVFKNYWSFEPIDQDQWFHQFTSPAYFRPAHWVIATTHEELVGFSINFINPEYIQCRSRREGYIAFVGVKEPWRRMGIGKSLVYHSLSVFKENAMTSAYLYVDENDYQYISSMYRHIGFQETHLSKIYRKFF